LESGGVQRLTNQLRIRSVKFFFAIRSDVTKRFSVLYPKYSDESKEGDDGDAGESNSISSHYGWLYTLRAIGEGPLLITGKKSILELNIIFLLNWMSMEKEMQIEQERAQRMANMVGRRV
jgi:hypothetical protein